MTRHVLMCEPVHYRIAYEINPWMRRSNAVLQERAQAQWRGLHRALEGLGVAIERVEPDPSLPDMPFTANAGIVIDRHFVPANFRYPERQPEAALFTAWFEARGYASAPVHEPHYWEGEGDVLDGGDGLAFAGYRFRTEYRALDHLDELLGHATIRLELADPRFYHLDTCLCPLGDGTALYYPPAFTSEAREALRLAVPDLIAVPEAEALRFACNAVVTPGAVVLNSGCPLTEAALRERGWDTVAVETDEFIKAGGSAKCLVLTLDSFAG